LAAAKPDSAALLQWWRGGEQRTAGTQLHAALQVRGMNGVERSIER
jgi:hypothetical protein